ncbi:N-acetyltransferase [Paenibacillaceae bacterium]|nr:N-acetyltransferase [Paenibacillaceae bacterium]
MELTYRTDIPHKEDYYYLFQSTGWNAEEVWSMNTLFEAIQNSWYIVTVYDGEKLVASGRLVSDGHVQCFICEMMVLPDYQKKGIGQEIMTQLLNHCKTNNIRWVQLSCASGKKAFYEKYGFRERAADTGMNLFL